MNTTRRICRQIFNEVVHRKMFLNVNSPRSVAFKSAQSLENLYPNSSLQLTTPSPPEKCDFYIPVDQLEITYSKSTGPGGQNVNKVNTKVDVRFHLATAKWIRDEVKQKMAVKFHNKVSKEGYLIFKSDLTRSQQLNLADCLEKIRASIRYSLIEKAEPTPETQERIRRRLERAAKERLMIKRHKSEIKSNRNDENVIM